jgi:microcystin-dependent protein
MAVERTYDGAQWHVTGGGQMVQPMLTGEVKMLAFASVPVGWLICDGSAVSRTTYADLFTAIGTTFGAGDGSTTFNLPDLMDRVPRGAAVPGGQGGSDSVTLTTSNMPSHTHTGPSHSHTAQARIQLGGGTSVAYNGNAVQGNQNTPMGNLWNFANSYNTGNAGAGNTGSAGSGNAVDITPSYVGMAFVIYTGGA